MIGREAQGGVSPFKEDPSSVPSGWLTSASPAKMSVVSSSSRTRFQTPQVGQRAASPETFCAALLTLVNLRECFLYRITSSLSQG